MIRLNDVELMPHVIDAQIMGTDSNDGMLDALGLVAQAQLKKVVEWSEELCDCLKNEYPTDHPPTKRRKCWKCWQALLKEIDVK